MKRIDLSEIDAYLFDLGGVVVDISPSAAIDAFKALGLKDIDEQITQSHHQGLFKQYELGVVSSDAFISALQKELPQQVGREAIVHAWNTMLVTLPNERVALLAKLRTTHPVYLLSNTNAIHHQSFKSMADGYDNLEELFTEVFYSYKMQLSKPDPECFQYVVNKTGLIPERTLFLDDSAKNLEAAGKLGFQTVLVSPNNTILDILKEF